MLQSNIEELYFRYQSLVYHRCLRLLGDPHSAQDATQETFVRVVQAAHRTSFGAHAAGWLFQVATNYCLNELRSRRTRATHVPDYSELASSPESSFLDQAQARALIRQLPPSLGAVVYLYFVDGLCQHEVAEALQISRRTVNNRLLSFRQWCEQNARPGTPSRLDGSRARFQETSPGTSTSAKGRGIGRSWAPNPAY